MAAAKKPAKSNKTAHVLNLLTAPGESAEGLPVVTEVAVEAPAPARPLTPPILEVARANDEHISEQIRVALEEELAAQSPPSSAKSSAQEEPTVEEMPPAVEVPPVEAPAEVLPPVDIPVPTPPVAEEVSPRTPSHEEVGYFNVMQALVEEKAPRYIRMFGLCPCNRCAADVKAWALNHLQPKYVVMRQIDRIPMLTVYEARYSAAVFSQLTQACKVVMDHPRHEEADFANETT